MQVQPFMFKSLKMADLEAEERARQAALAAAMQQEALAPTFSEEELLAAQKEAQALGYAKGKAEALAEAEAARIAREKQMLKALEVAQVALQQAAQRYTQTLEADLTPFAQIVLHAAQKYAQKTLETHPLEAVAHMLQEARALLLSAPKVTVQVHPELVEPLREKVAVWAGQLHLEVHADPQLKAGDCRIDWGSGKAERSVESLWKEIESVLARGLGVKV